MAHAPNGPERIVAFANACQIAVGGWLDADDLPSRVGAFWTALIQAPDESRFALVVSRIVLGFADRFSDVRNAPSVPHSRIGSMGRARVVRALTCICDRYADPDMNLSFVSEHVGISTCHLSRLIARETGHGFETHLHGIRLLVAAVLLRDTLDSIGQVARAVGYSSATNFERWFKRWLSMSPTEFRLLSARRF
jgi:AraC-like DNA-binding protein